MSINYVMPQIEAKLKKWELLEYINKGWEGVEDNIESIIKKEKSEEIDGYTYRKEKLTHFNFYTPTLKAISGLVFSKPIVLSEDTPSQVKALRNDFDDMGNSMDKIAGEMFYKALNKGIAFAFIDSASTEGIITLADEKNFKVRPYVVQVKAENVTSFKFDALGLAQVKIREFVTENDPDNYYATIAIEQYRVLERGTYDVYRIENGKEVKKEELSGFTGMKEILFYSLNLMEESRFLAGFPFYDLAKQNIRHTQMFTDVGHSIHLANVPMLTSFGFEKEDLKIMSIGANKLMNTTSTEGRMAYLTLDTNCVENSNLLTDKLESEMLKAGLSVLSEGNSSNNITALEAGIDATSKQSKLTRWVNALEETMGQLIEGMSKRYGQTGGGIKINSDIAQIPLTAQEITAYTNMVNSGTLSHETFFNTMQERKNINNEIDFEEEVVKIQKDGMLSIKNEID